jgi:thiopurine S-methyltransferase
MAKQARLLVVTMDYDADEMSGPPFYVSKQDLATLFPRATITELDRFSILETHPRWQELELSRLDEVLYHIQINN